MAWTNWTIHDGVLFAFLLVVVLVILRAHDHLRMKSPKLRVVIGGIGICLSCLIFFGTMHLLTRPETAKDALVHDAALLAACSLFSGLLILSLMQILGGIIQGFKRWRYYRRKVQ
ncbi:hypothetical protein [Sphingobium sp. CAP-1]|uniref:hypothetical protein n=1 Tax=Sphingobium sp. CAP-1 TaxID=2676077 RepID=UPI0012BB2B86|nr:hypothetical protein [Sphingobium sp. CAP-1]QGP78039.1 hypothetical protein GL174_02745 [Sphingobium sp. CAP-1]